MKRTPPKIVSLYRRRFYRDQLTEENLEEVMVVKNLHLTDAPFAKEGRYFDIEGFGKVIFSGQYKSSVTRQSTDLLNRHKENPDDCRHDMTNAEFNLFDYKVDVLAMRPEGELYEDFADHDYYEKYPERLKPDTVLGFKVIE